MRLTGAVLVFLLVPAACSTTTGKLKARFAKEHACEEDEVQVSGQGGTTYVASGCGQTAEYVCPGIGGLGDSGRACEEQGVTKKPGSETPPLPGPNDKPEPPGPRLP